MWQIFNQVNDYRARHGLRKLDQRFDLHAYTQPHSDLLSQNSELFHSNIREIVTRFGARAAENVAMHSDPGQIVAEWAKSPGHAQNMRGPYTGANVGLTYAGGYYYCTMIYIASR